MAYFDSSSWYCLVDRACGDTARDSAGRLLEHAEQTELLFTTGQRSLAGPDNSSFLPPTHPFPFDGVGWRHYEVVGTVLVQLRVYVLIFFSFFTVVCEGLCHGICFSRRSCVEVSMVLDHSVSQPSKNSHSRTQTVEGGRCVYEQRHGGMRQSWILR